MGWSSFSFGGWFFRSHSEGSKWDGTHWCGGRLTPPHFLWWCPARLQAYERSWELEISCETSQFKNCGSLSSLWKTLTEQIPPFCRLDYVAWACQLAPDTRVISHKLQFFKLLWNHPFPITYLITSSWRLKNTVHCRVFSTVWCSSFL